MKSKEQVLLEIEESGLVAVIRGESPDKALQLVELCARAGVQAVEMTFTVPLAHRALERAAELYGDQLLLGAGTVLDPETARIALLSGAQFIVAPHLNPETVRLCNRYRVANIAGFQTVREAVEAMEAGADMLKLFPAGPYGPAYLKDLRGPLPYAKVLPTGGIGPDTAGDWIRAGAAAVGAGSSLTKGDAAANAAAYLEAIREARRPKEGRIRG